jgi:hypothetical protein
MRHYLLLAISILFLGCDKKQQVQASACQRYSTGTLSVTNTWPHPFIVSVDGTDKGVVAGGGGQTFEIPSGRHSVTATQQSGYVIPTTKTGAVDIVQCQTTSFTFP